MLEFLQHLQVYRIVFLRSVERKDTDSFFPFHVFQCFIDYFVIFHSNGLRVYPSHFLSGASEGADLSPVSSSSSRCSDTRRASFFSTIPCRTEFTIRSPCSIKFFGLPIIRHLVHICSIVPRMIALSRYGSVVLLKVPSLMPSLMQSSKISAPFLIILKASVDRKFLLVFN